MYRPCLGSVSDVWRVWFDSWRPWHVALLMGGSVAALIGMTLLLHHGVWVLLPIVCLALLALCTPLGDIPSPPVQARRAQTASQRDTERRRKQAEEAANRNGPTGV